MYYYFQNYHILYGQHFRYVVIGEKIYLLNAPLIILLEKTKSVILCKC